MFDPTLPNSGAGNIPGALKFVAGRHVRFYPTYMKNFGPHVGLAWRLGDKTVFRAGYVLLYNLSPGEMGNDASGFRQGFGTSNLAISNVNPYLPLYNLWVDGQPVDPNANRAANTDPTQQNGGGPTWFHSSSTRPTRMQQWTAGIQRQLPHEMMIEARYSGFKSTGNDSSLDIVNQVNPSFLKL